MARAPDEQIPPDEALYRSISAADVIGNDVLSSAVDLPRCSFNRGKFSTPEDVLVSRRPDDTGIVSPVASSLTRSPGPAAPPTNSSAQTTRIPQRTPTTTRIAKSASDLKEIRSARITR
jgi:hypothetical protein